MKILKEKVDKGHYPAVGSCYVIKYISRIFGIFKSATCRKYISYKKNYWYLTKMFLEIIPANFL